MENRVASYHPSPAFVPEKITVLLADDHAIWLGSIRRMLEDTEFETIAEACSCPVALEVARQLRPAMLLLDSDMGGGDGLDTLGALKREHPGMAVVMFTASINAFQMARTVLSGAAGYLRKDLEQEKLLGALRAIASGATVVMVP